MNLILNIAVIVLAFIIFFRGIYYFFEALQLLISVREYFQSINRPYIPFISSGMPYGAMVENAPLHIEAILFDTFLFGIIYPLQKRKFGG